MVQKKSRVILKKSVHFVRAQVRIPYCFVIMSDSSENSLLGIDVVERPVRIQTVIQHASKRTCWCFWKSCGIVFESLDQLADHVTQVHSSSGPGGLFYCGWEGCTRNDKGFNARYKMLVHVRTHTNQKPHECFQCHKSFSRAENLKIHFRSHSGEKPYVCPLPGCNKAYSNSSDRFKHTRTHQIEKPYTCKVAGCSKSYTDPSSLRKHVKTYKHNIHNQDNANAGQNAPFFIDPTNAQMCYQKKNLWKEFLDIEEESTRLSRNSCDKFWDMPMDLRINQNSK